MNDTPSLRGQVSTMCLFGGKGDRSTLIESWRKRLLIPFDSSKLLGLAHSSRLTTALGLAQSSRLTTTSDARRDNSCQEYEQKKFQLKSSLKSASQAKLLGLCFS